MLWIMLLIFVIFVINYCYNALDGTYDADKWGVYKDKNGLYRWKKNKHRVEYTPDWKGNYILKDCNTGKILINLTEEAAKKSKERSIKNGRTVYMVNAKWNNNEPKNINPDIKGSRYRDINTGRYYVIRKEKGITESCIFYMDMLTYEYVRVADCFINGKTKEQIEKINNDAKYFIEARQRKIKNHKGKKTEWLLYNNHGYDCECGEFDDLDLFIKDERRKEK